MKKITPFFPAIFWTMILLLLCLAPGKDIPNIPWLEKIHFDKVVHFFLFGGFVLFWSFGILQKNSKRLPYFILLFTLISIALGISVEFMQKYWIPGRDFEIGDMVADAIGALVFAALFTRYKEKIRSLSSYFFKSRP